jgi:hypothetical protein
VHWQAVALQDGWVGSLADAVLPLIRTRADLHRRGPSRQHGVLMHEAVDLLERALPTGNAIEVHTVTHKALTSAIKVISRADDSTGVIGDACRRLLDLHPRTAAAASTPPGRLVDWMIAFQFDGDVDYFGLDPVAYAPALGPDGITAYRHRLTAIQQRVGAPPADPLAAVHRHEHWVLSWNEQRLAVLDRDADAVIATHARDRRVARWFHDTAVALTEIDRLDLATDWARQGTEVEPFHQALQCADLWCALLGQQPHYNADDVLKARRSVFDRWPTATTAARLHDAALATGRTCADIDGHVLDRLAQQPWDAVSVALHTLGDPRRAWQLAHDLDLNPDDTRTWSALATAYEPTDPSATLPVHARLVERDLTHSDAGHYRDAARRLARMRALAADTGDEKAIDRVDQLITDLRLTHRRRPRLQQEFDRARLP